MWHLRDLRYLWYLKENDRNWAELIYYNTMVLIGHWGILLRVHLPLMILRSHLVWAWHLTTIYLSPLGKCTPTKIPQYRKLRQVQIRYRELVVGGWETSYSKLHGKQPSKCKKGTQHVLFMASTCHISKGVPSILKEDRFIIQVKTN